MNPLVALKDSSAQIIFSYIFETLMSPNIINYEWQPHMIEEWKLSTNHKILEFKLRDQLKWSDGQEITTSDIKFSIKYFKKYLPVIKNLKIIDKKRIRFEFDNPSYQNINSFFYEILRIIPEHVYAKKAISGALGSGPYKVTHYEKGKPIVLKLNNNWWGRNKIQFQGMYNYETIIFTFEKDPVVIEDKIKKGEMDFSLLNPQSFMKISSKVQKIKAMNEAPRKYSYIAWNFKSKIFQDKRVRLALAHLLNRDLIIKKYFPDLYLPSTGPWFEQSMYASRSTPPLEFNPQKSLQLLSQAGWALNKKNHLLEKILDGKKIQMRFTIHYDESENFSYLKTYQEDAKKIGVEIQLKATHNKQMQKLKAAGQFAALASTWDGPQVHLNPKSIWHSTEEKNPRLNFIHYKNPEVDQLIKEIQNILEPSKRAPLLQKIYQLIAADSPYLFLFHEKYLLYVQGPKVKKQQDTYRFFIGQQFWSNNS